MEDFVARSPIFDRNGGVFAYRLLTSGRGPDLLARLLPEVEPADASGQLLSLLAGRPPWLELEQRSPVEGALDGEGVEQLIVELRGGLRADEELAKILSAARIRGIRVAVQASLHPDTEALYLRADLVLIDFLVLSADQREQAAREIHHARARLVAVGIEDERSLLEARSLGCSYFEGPYFYGVPEGGRAKGIQRSRAICLSLLHDIRRPDVEIARLAELVSKEPWLTVRLLREMQRASVAVTRERFSVREAIQLLGLVRFRRLMSLAILARLGEGGNDELVVISLIRARYSEILAAEVQGVDPSDAFLAGLLSLLDALLAMPLSEIVPTLALPSDVEAVLLGEPGPASDLLELVLSYEQGIWDRCEELREIFGLERGLLPRSYVRAVGWAEAARRP